VNVKPETIGDCEVCGIVDHHLVSGECPRCRGKREAQERAYARRQIAAKARYPRSAYAPSLAPGAVK